MGSSYRRGTEKQRGAFIHHKDTKAQRGEERFLDRIDRIYRIKKPRAP
jgi:hypothetical protein